MLVGALQGCHQPNSKKPSGENLFKAHSLFSESQPSTLVNLQSSQQTLTNIQIHPINPSYPTKMIRLVPSMQITGARSTNPNHTQSSNRKRSLNKRRNSHPTLEHCVCCRLYRPNKMKMCLEKIAKCRVFIEDDIETYLQLQQHRIYEFSDEDYFGFTNNIYDPPQLLQSAKSEDTVIDLKKHNNSQANPSPRTSPFQLCDEPHQTDTFDKCIEPINSNLSNNDNNQPSSIQDNNLCYYILEKSFNSLAAMPSKSQLEEISEEREEQESQLTLMNKYLTNVESSPLLHTAGDLYEYPMNTLSQRNLHSLSITQTQPLSQIPIEEYEDEASYNNNTHQAQGNFVNSKNRSNENDPLTAMKLFNGFTNLPSFEASGSARQFDSFGKSHQHEVPQKTQQIPSLLQPQLSWYETSEKTQYEPNIYIHNRMNSIENKQLQLQLQQNHHEKQSFTTTFSPHIVDQQLQQSSLEDFTNSISFPCIQEHTDREEPLHTSNSRRKQHQHFRSQSCPFSTPYFKSSLLNKSEEHGQNIRVMTIHEEEPYQNYVIMSSARDQRGEIQRIKNGTSLANHQTNQNIGGCSTGSSRNKYREQMTFKAASGIKKNQQKISGKRLQAREHGGDSPYIQLANFIQQQRSQDNQTKSNQQLNEVLMKSPLDDTNYLEPSFHSEVYDGNSERICQAEDYEREQNQMNMIDQFYRQESESRFYGGVVSQKRQEDDGSEGQSDGSNGEQRQQISCIFSANNSATEEQSRCSSMVAASRNPIPSVNHQISSQDISANTLLKGNGSNSHIHASPQISTSGGEISQSLSKNIGYPGVGTQLHSTPSSSSTTHFRNLSLHSTKNGCTNNNSTCVNNSTIWSTKSRGKAIKKSGKTNSLEGCILQDIRKEARSIISTGYPSRANQRKFHKSHELCKSIGSSDQVISTSLIAMPASNYDQFVEQFSQIQYGKHRQKAYSISAPRNPSFGSGFVFCNNQPPIQPLSQSQQQLNINQIHSLQMIGSNLNSPSAGTQQLRQLSNRLRAPTNDAAQINNNEQRSVNYLDTTDQGFISFRNENSSLNTSKQEEGLEENLHTQMFQTTVDFKIKLQTNYTEICKRQLEKKRKRLLLSIRFYLQVVSPIQATLDANAMLSGYPLGHQQQTEFLLPFIHRESNNHLVSPLVSFLQHRHLLKHSHQPIIPGMAIPACVNPTILLNRISEECESPQNTTFKHQMRKESLQDYRTATHSIFHSSVNHDSPLLADQQEKEIYFSNMAAEIPPFQRFDMRFGQSDHSFPRTSQEIQSLRPPDLMNTNCAPNDWKSQSDFKSNLFKDAVSLSPHKSSSILPQKFDDSMTSTVIVRGKLQDIVKNLSLKVSEESMAKDFKRATPQKIINMKQSIISSSFNKSLDHPSVGIRIARPNHNLLVEALRVQLALTKPRIFAEIAEHILSRPLLSFLLVLQENSDYQTVLQGVFAVESNKSARQSFAIENGQPKILLSDVSAFLSIDPIDFSIQLTSEDSQHLQKNLCNTHGVIIHKTSIL